MKTQILICLALCSALIGHGQELAFSNVSVNNIHNRKMISFTLSREVNVRHYRIEAGNDSAHFTVLATIASEGDAVLSREYSYDLAGYAYKYYRVGVVKMNGELVYSRVLLGINEASDRYKRINIQPDNTLSKVIVNR